MSEKLIYAMSTREKMKLSQFFEYFRAAYIDESLEVNESVDLRHKVVRILDSLGYCEFDFKNNMVYMCKPSLVLLPIYGLPKVLLTGARIPSFIDLLKNIVKKQGGKALLSFYSQSHININIPPAIIIEASNKEILHNIAKEINIECNTEVPASWSLSFFSTSISEIMAGLYFEPRDPPDWKSRMFNTGLLSFTQAQKENNDGLTLIEYRNPVNQQLLHLLWSKQTATEVERDWGRYLVLSSKGKKVIHYDERLYLLAVPMTLPLPCILARAVTLCTGIAPKSTMIFSDQTNSEISKFPVQIYWGVAPCIASLIAKKLSCEFIKSMFKFDEEGMLHV